MILPKGKDLHVTREIEEMRGHGLQEETTLDHAMEIALQPRYPVLQGELERHVLVKPQKERVKRMTKSRKEKAIQSMEKVK